MTNSVSSFGLRHSFGIRHSSFVIPDNHFQFYFLKGELIVNKSEQLQSARIGHVRATQLNPRPLADKLRVRLRHFAIEQK
jgi:hypothetical protein